MEKINAYDRLLDSSVRVEVLNLSRELRYDSSTIQLFLNKKYMSFYSDLFHGHFMLANSLKLDTDRHVLTEYFNPTSNIDIYGYGIDSSIMLARSSELYRPIPPEVASDLGIIYKDTDIPVYHIRKVDLVDGRHIFDTSIDYVNRDRYNYFYDTLYCKFVDKYRAYPNKDDCDFISSLAISGVINGTSLFDPFDRKVDFFAKDNFLKDKSNLVTYDSVSDYKKCMFGLLPVDFKDTFNSSTGVIASMWKDTGLLVFDNRRYVRGKILTIKEQL